MPLAGILFDKDGTLIDHQHSWGGATLPVMEQVGRGDRAAVERMAATVQYAIDERRYHPESVAIAATLGQIADLWGGAIGRSGDPALEAEVCRLFEVEVLRHLMPIGDPIAVLDTLRARGFKLGVATNDTEAAALQQMKALGIHGHMDFIAGFDSGHGGKPEPGMVLAFARQLGVEPAAVMLVGDTPHDLKAARAAGAIGVAVLSGPMGRDKLEHLADHVIGSIADLPALLDRLG